MLSAIAIVPSAPVMVPELAASAASETADLREAAVSAAAALPRHWIVIGAARSDSVHGPDSVGTFAGYGVDVRVGLSAHADGDPSALPLCVLVAAWLRGVANPQAHADARAYRCDLDPAAALDIGRQLRAQVEAAADDIGVLVVADGANTLSPQAPGGHDPDSPRLQQALDRALSTGDAAALACTPGTIVGRVGLQVLAGLTEPGPRSAHELYRGAPYGVGYFVGIWTP